MAVAPRSPAPRAPSPRRSRPGGSRPKRSTRACSRVTCSPRTCRIPISSSAPAASSASAISCCGRRRIPSSSSPRRCGPISARPISRKRCATITAANVATAPPLDRADAKLSSLRLRILSALVMAPVALPAVGVGRPRLSPPGLAPRLSPNKTWAGLVGGVASAALAGLIAARLGGGSGGVLALVSAGVAVVAQLGDLAESLAKRHFGVKDSSRLIPGHGGLLDRLDGLLAASVATGVAAMLLDNSYGPIHWQ